MCWELPAFLRSLVRSFVRSTPWPLVAWFIGGQCERLAAAHRRLRQRPKRLRRRPWPPAKRRFAASCRNNAGPRLSHHNVRLVHLPPSYAQKKEEEEEGERDVFARVRPVDGRPRAAGRQVVNAGFVNGLQDPGLLMTRAYVSNASTVNVKGGKRKRKETKRVFPAEWAMRLAHAATECCLFGSCYH